MEEGEGRRAHLRHPVKGRSAKKGRDERSAFGDGVFGVAVERGESGGARVGLGIVGVPREECVAPTALGDRGRGSPALTRWAKFWRASGAGCEVRENSSRRKVAGEDFQ